jgi:nucleotide-binding universal stress UspA family protein
MPRMKLIIAATDGSQGAERAVAIAADLAKIINAKLLIVNVSEDKLSTAQNRLIARLRISEGDALEEISGRILSRAKSIAEKHGAANIETMTGSGHPAKVLLKIANTRHAYAIVVGKRGAGPFKELLLGSVSQKLASLAPCILIVAP